MRLLECLEHPEKAERMTPMEARMEEERIWIYAVRDLRAGEELTFNYGYDLQDYEEHPCHCGAPDCLGFMVAEEHFKHVRRKRQQTG